MVYIIYKSKIYTNCRITSCMAALFSLNEWRRFCSRFRIVTNILPLLFFFLHIALTFTLVSKVLVYNTKFNASSDIRIYVYKLYNHSHHGDISIHKQFCLSAMRMVLPHVWNPWHHFSYFREENRFSTSIPVWIAGKACWYCGHLFAQQNAGYNKWSA